MLMVFAHRARMILCLVLLLSMSAAWFVSAQIPDRCDGNLAYQVTAELSQETYEGRYSGSPGYISAAQYMAGLLREIGLSPIGQDGTYLQPYPETTRPRPRLALLQSLSAGGGL